MPAISYAWNPFQERVDCHIANEVIKKSTDVNRVEFVPRAAPFFGHNVTLYEQGNPTPLKLGIDYVFGHLFKGFTTEYNRNAFGSIILLKNFANAVLSVSYDTIGGPLVLDETTFATLVGNIANGPRQANWEDLVNVPTEWPADPHDHPAAQTYDYTEMMEALTSLILATSNANQNVPSLQSILEEHLEAPLQQAHSADAADVGLDLTPNMEAADISDLAGNSSNLLVTIAVLKEALRQVGIDSQSLGSSAEVAQVAYFAMDTAPAGWLVADGSEVSRTGYQALFNRIGTKYGEGDGSTTFNLPNLIGTFIKGAGNERAVGSVQEQQFPTHYHGFGYTPPGSDNWYGIIRPWAAGPYKCRYCEGQSGWGGTIMYGGDDAPDTNNAIATSDPVHASGENCPANTALLPCIKH